MIHHETLKRKRNSALQTKTNRHAARPLSGMRRCSQGVALVLAILAALHFGAGTAAGQSVGLNNATPDASSILDLKATDRGLLIPRMTEAQKDAIAAPATGLLVFQTDGTAGFYFYNGSAWVALSSAATGWGVSGNAGTTNGTNFLGTTDAQDLDIRTNDVIRHRFTQQGQMEFLNTGNSVFIGEGAGANDDLSNNQNVFVGYQAGNANTTRTNLVAIGNAALYSNTTGIGNTAIGSGALYSNTIGNSNTAIGSGALYENIDGLFNTAVGRGALGNSNGDGNTATGEQALMLNSTGNQNTANGFGALSGNIQGNNNTAIGMSSLFYNIDGSNNTANGYYALVNSTGNGNIALGHSAGDNLTAGDNNIFIGYDIDAPIATGSNQMSIGNLIYATGVDGIGTTVSSGNVGIGNNAPGYKLDVSGDINITGDYRINGVAQSFTDAQDLALTGNTLSLTNDATTVDLSSYLDNTDDWTNAGSDIYFSVGEVGIGTNPTAKLHIQQDGSGIADGIKFTSFVVGTEDWYQYMNVNDDLTFRDDGNDVMVLQNNTGNVGIGSPSPAVKLDVVGAVKTSRLGTYGTYLSTEVQGIWSISEGFTIDEVNDDFGNQYGMGYAYNLNGGSPFSSEHQIVFTNSGTINAAIGLGGSGYFGGNVKIGTTAGSEKVTIRGTGSTSATNSFLVENSTGADIFKIRDDVRIGIGSAPNTSYQLYNNVPSTSSVSYNQRNYFYRNTTTKSGTMYGLYNYTNRGTSASTGVVYGFYGSTYNNIGTSSTYGIRTFTTGTSTGVKYGIYSTTSGSGTRYAGYFAGDVYCSGTYLPSDESLKKNISNFDNALSKVNTIAVKEYEYIHEGDLSKMDLPKGRQVGIMAQDLENVFPQLTKDSEFDLNDDPENEDENREENILKFQVVNYTGLVPVLVKAMQEQQEQIASLQSALESQQQVITALQEK